MLSFLLNLSYLLQRAMWIKLDITYKTIKWEKILNVNLINLEHYSCWWSHLFFWPQCHWWWNHGSLLGRSQGPLKTTCLAWLPHFTHNDSQHLLRECLLFARYINKCFIHIIFHVFYYEARVIILFYR